MPMSTNQGLSSPCPFSHLSAGCLIRFCISASLNGGNQETSTGHPHWLQRACLTLHVMSRIPRFSGLQGCLTLARRFSLLSLPRVSPLGCLTSLTVAQVLGSAEVAASPTHPAALAFSVALSTCTLRIGTSRLPLSPPSRPSRERARCTLCRACHLRSAGLPCLSAGCPTSSAGCRPHNLLRDKPGGFS
ncbi:hypothetical protein SAMN05660706_1141, partial [Desulfoscipio geothermicus DSM 3669]